MMRLAIAVLAVIALALPARAGIPVETPASHAVLVDYDTGEVLFAKNADTLMPPSSMSKLMTATMVFEKLRDGSLKLSDTFHVSEKAWRMGGSKMFVRVDTDVSIEDLLRGVIVQSGNDACVVLAEGIAGDEDTFSRRMTERGREIGLTSSTFMNSTGWPAEGHLMTARDLATLARHMIQTYPEFMHYYSEMSFTYNGISQGNRNPLLGDYAGADGMKTGHTEDAGYGLVGTAVRNGQRLILVVNGLESMAQRESETKRLLDIGFREYARYALFEQNATVGEAAVYLGDRATVPLRVGDPLSVLLRREVRKEMKVTIRYMGPIAAPIAEGQQIAELIVSAPDIEPVRAPLFAAEAVGGAGFLPRIVASIQALAFGPEHQTP